MPVGIVAFVGGWLFLGDTRADHAQKLDLGGVLLLSASLGLLVYPLVEGRAVGWPLWAIAMLGVVPIVLLAFIRFEQHIVRRGGAPLVDLSLFRADGFAIGTAMAAAFYMLSAFYLTFAIYLQGGLGLSPLAAGMRTLPFGIGYFLTSLMAGALMARLGVRALTLGFAVQIAGFSALIFAVVAAHPELLEIALVVAGVGFGIVMPSVIKAVVGGVEPRFAGLASGIVISTFQIGSALGVAIVGGVFFSILGTGRSLADHAHAFAIALGSNIALLALGGLLSLWLPDDRGSATSR